MLRSPFVLAGAALALAGAGSASAATIASPAAPSARGGGVSIAARPGHHKAAIQKRPSARPGVPTRARTAARTRTPAAAEASKPETRPASEQLIPVGTTGPQAWMPLSRAQLANAATIVRQAMASRMGARSAVIAVATAMQESRLLNIGYGDRDSLGLFQQRPSCGWGTAQQILNPAHAADAFLAALRKHQASDPSWAAQPLWAVAQTVQRSGVPLAYAKWESQAARLVQQIATSPM